MFAQNSAVIINNINKGILIGTQNCKPIETSELVYYIRYIYDVLKHTYVRCNSRRIFDSLDEDVKYIGAKSVLICTVMPFFIERDDRQRDLYFGFLLRVYLVYVEFFGYNGTRDPFKLRVCHVVIAQLYYLPVVCILSIFLLSSPVYARRARIHRSVH